MDIHAWAPVQEVAPTVPVSGNCTPAIKEAYGQKTVAFPTNENPWQLRIYPGSGTKEPALEWQSCLFPQPTLDGNRERSLVPSHPPIQRVALERLPSRFFDQSDQ